MTECKADDCKAKIFCKGLCKKHYTRMARYGRLYTVRAEKGTKKGKCKAEDCARDAKCQGYCIMHYKRVQRNGSTARVLNKYEKDQPCA